VKPAIALLLVALTACAPSFREASRALGQDLPPLGEPVLDRRRSYFDNDTTRPHREFHVLIYPDGRHVPHGRDTSWYADGKLEWEREFEDGEPTGVWRSWYENGSPRSEATFGSADLAPMRWWHANGQLSSEGLAVNGAKDGAWTHWHANGVTSAEGRYLLGKREGPWTLWKEDGAIAERVEYRADQKVGPVVGE
jgi:hypothetical protein